MAMVVGFAATLAPDGRASAPLSGAAGWSSLPVGAAAAVSRGLGGDRRSYFAEEMGPGGVSFTNRAQGLRATAAGGRVALSGAHGLRFALGSLAIGRGNALTLVPRLGPGSRHRNKLVFSSATVTEWLANGPLGVEQGFTLAHRPAGEGPLAISQTLSGDATGRVAAGGQSVMFSSSAGALRYAGLVVTDASGARVPARLSVARGRLTISIADGHAVYPLRVDPEFQQAAELTDSDGTGDELGYSVAVSGSTIVAGAPQRNGYEGAVYLYTEPASGGWASATQTAKLTASDGAANDNLGYSVAVSGSTIVAGAVSRTVGANTSQGAVYEWTMPAGGWSGTLSQTAELTASDGIPNGDLGWSVAVAGSTIVAGAPGQGAAYVWTMPAGGWAGASTQTAELSDTADDLGSSVAISAAASTIVIGGVGYDNFRGAVYVYAEPPSGGWAAATQTAQLTASDGAPNDYLGDSVAVSGSTIVGGGPVHGAAYVWTMPAGGWVNATQTAELTASDYAPGDDLGYSVAVSGSTIVAGAPDQTLGTSYVYVMPAAGGWVDATQTAELTDSSGGFDELGYAVAASGSTIFAGARYGSPGAVYVFRPTLDDAAASLTLSPASIVANGTSTSTATFEVEDTSGNPVTGDSVTITSAGAQTVGPVTQGAIPGTYQATITSTTTAGSATVTASDTSVSPGVSATATLTQTPPQGAAPPRTPPSNAFTITRAAGSRDGTIVLTLALPGPGTLALLGTHEDVLSAGSSMLEPGARRFDWGRERGTVTTAGKIRIALRPASRGRELLARHRHYGMALNVTVWATYTPTGGSARTAKRTVSVLKAAERRPLAYSTTQPTTSCSVRRSSGRSRSNARSASSVRPRALRQRCLAPAPGRYL